MRHMQGERINIDACSVELVVGGLSNVLKNEPEYFIGCEFFERL